MEHRVTLCRRTAYIGLTMVIVVYIALSALAGGLETMGELPGWLVPALQLLLGIGSALTVTGVLLGMYYKGKAGKNGRLKGGKGK